MKHVILPWLVKERDLWRYLGRVLKACQGGRVLLFHHRDRTRARTILIALAPVENWEARTDAACAAFATGRFRKITLADLPKKRRLPQHT